MAVAIAVVVVVGLISAVVVVVVVAVAVVVAAVVVAVVVAIVFDIAIRPVHLNAVHYRRSSLLDYLDSSRLVVAVRLLLSSDFLAAVVRIISDSVDCCSHHYCPLCCMVRYRTECSVDNDRSVVSMCLLNGERNCRLCPPDDVSELNHLSLD